MEWILLVIIGLVVYFFVVNNPKKVKEEKIQRLEESAESIYGEQVDKQKESKKEDKKLLANIEKAKKEILGFNEHETKKSIKGQEQRLKVLKEFKKKYIRLKERYAFSPIDERLNLALDYHAYMTTFLDMDVLVALVTYGTHNLKTFDEIDSCRENVKELIIKQEEISKRFDKRLARSN